MIGLSRLWRCSLLLLASLGMQCPSLLAVERLEDFSTRVELRLDGDGPWYRLELPMALRFAARHSDLRDLRVFNAEGEALAYALARGNVDARSTRHEYALHGFPLRGPLDGAGEIPSVRVERGASGTVVQVLQDTPTVSGDVLRGWLLDASEVKGILEMLSLEWSGGEGFQHFSIEASDDLQHWTSWGEGQVGRLSFANQRIEQREVSLPGHSARYLRLLWESPKQAPELMAAKGVSASRESLPPAMSWSVPLQPLSAKDNQYLWELPLGLPIERLRIAVDRAGSLLPVQVEARNDDAPQWRSLTSGLLYRLPQDGKEIVRDELEVPGWQSVKQLRLTVDPRAGGFGQQIPRLEVGMRTTEVVLLARGTPPFTLALGRAGANRQELPLATLVPDFNTASLAKMGHAKALATAQSTTVQPTTAQAVERQATGQAGWKRIALWAMLLLGVGLLGGMALSLLRRPAPRS